VAVEQAFFLLFPPSSTRWRPGVLHACSLSAGNHARLTRSRCFLLNHDQMTTWVPPILRTINFSSKTPPPSPAYEYIHLRRTKKSSRQTIRKLVVGHFASPPRPYPSTFPTSILRRYFESVNKEPVPSTQPPMRLSLGCFFLSLKEYLG